VLPREALLELLAVRHARVQELDRDLRFRGATHTAVDGAVPALSDHLHEPIATADQLAYPGHDDPNPSFDSRISGL
jgi:hypothetical protein